MRLLSRRLGSIFLYRHSYSSVLIRSRYIMRQAHDIMALCCQHPIITTVEPFLVYACRRGGKEEEGRSRSRLKGEQGGWIHGTKEQGCHFVR